MTGVPIECRQGVFLRFLKRRFYIEWFVRARPSQWLTPQQDPWSISAQTVPWYTSDTHVTHVWTWRASAILLLSMVHSVNARRQRVIVALTPCHGTWLEGERIERITCIYADRLPKDGKLHAVLRIKTSHLQIHKLEGKKVVLLSWNEACCQYAR